MLRDKAKEYIEIEKKYGDKSHLYHYNCAEVILNASNDYYKLGLDNQALKMIVPFGGGMVVQKDCGLLTGGVAVIGAMFTEDKPSENLKLKRITKRWVEEFEKEFKDTNCKTIKDVNLAENEGCNRLKLVAAEILEKIIDDNLE